MSVNSSMTTYLNFPLFFYKARENTKTESPLKLLDHRHNFKEGIPDDNWKKGHMRHGNGMFFANLYSNAL